MDEKYGDDDIEEVDVNSEDDKEKVVKNVELDDDDETQATEEDVSDDEQDDADADAEEQEPERLGTAFPEIEDDEDDEEDDDEFYLQKFDETTQQKIIADFHPELHAHNYDEIDALSRVVRDENGNIIDPLHKTVPFITRYEKARILGERAKQINAGAKPFVELEPNVIDGYVIALKEFEAKKIPFIVKRPMPNGGVEYWRFEDLEVLV
jgi:DNA-directed RNA polymerase subunit K/omega